MSIASRVVAQLSNYPKRVKRLALICGLLVGAWYLIFQWNSFDYPPWGAKPYIYYSPNCQYYISKHYTLWEKITESSEFGTARLYDSSSNKLLYEGKTLLDAQAGPYWSNTSKGEGIVFFVGSRSGHKDEEWGFSLPTSPGRFVNRQKCPITQGG